MLPSKARLGEISTDPAWNGSATSQGSYYVVDVLVLEGRTSLPGCQQLCREFLPRTAEPIRAIRERGIVAKRMDSVYEPGQCSGAWQKCVLIGGKSSLFGWRDRFPELANLRHPVNPPAK